MCRVYTERVVKNMKRISKLIKFPADLVAEIEKVSKRKTISQVLRVQFMNLSAKVYVCRIVNVAQTTPYPKAIHLPPTHWATPFTFLEVGVFSPIVDKNEIPILLKRLRCKKYSFPITLKSFHTWIFFS